MGRETMTLGQAAALIGGKIDPNHAQIAFHGVNFDTRRLQEGQLFVAMAGARDGHDFVPQALEKGAVAVLASKPLDASIPAIYVEDTAKALQDLAREYRKLLPLRCVDVTEATAAEDACKIEHIISDETFAAIKGYLQE